MMAGALEGMTMTALAPTSRAAQKLAEAGMEYDSSIFPVRHDRYGVPDAPDRPHWAVGPGGGRMLELPPLTTRVLGVNLPIAGGGYLRLVPIATVGWALRRAQAQGRTGVLYLHPWELDPGQPVLPMPLLSRMRHRVNLHKTAAKLRWLLDRFNFVAAIDAARGLHEAGLESFKYSDLPIRQANRAVPPSNKRGL